MSEIIKNADLFYDLIKKAFGRWTMDARQIAQPEYEAQFRKRIPQTFFYDRNKHAIPINRKSIKPILDLYRFVFEDRTVFDSITTSQHLALILQKTCGLSPSSRLAFSVDDDNDLRERKKYVFDYMLHEMLYLISGESYIETQSIRTVLHRVISEAESFSSSDTFDQIGFSFSNYGFIECSDRFIEDLSFSQRCDIVAFDCFDFTNSFIRSAAYERMQDSNASIRVSFMDPSSPFFVPYCRLLNIDPALQRDKIFSLLFSWIKMHTRAVENSMSWASLLLSLNSGLPSKQMLRFDNALYVSANSNSLIYEDPFVLKCAKFAYHGSVSSFDIFEKEIDSIFDSGKPFFQVDAFPNPFAYF